jgi:hypothetical protein
VKARLCASDFCCCCGSTVLEPLVCKSLPVPAWKAGLCASDCFFWAALCSSHLSASSRVCASPCLFLPVGHVRVSHSFHCFALGSVRTAAVLRRGEGEGYFLLVWSRRCCTQSCPYVHMWSGLGVVPRVSCCSKYSLVLLQCCTAVLRCDAVVSWECWEVMKDAGC